MGFLQLVPQRWRGPQPRGGPEMGESTSIFNLYNYPLTRWSSSLVPAASSNPLSSSFPPGFSSLLQGNKTLGFECRRRPGTAAVFQSGKLFGLPAAARLRNGQAPAAQNPRRFRACDGSGACGRKHPAMVANCPHTGVNPGYKTRFAVSEEISIPCKWTPGVQLAAR